MSVKNDSHCYEGKRWGEQSRGGRGRGGGSLFWRKVLWSDWVLRIEYYNGRLPARCADKPGGGGDPALPVADKGDRGPEHLQPDREPGHQQSRLLQNHPQGGTPHLPPKNAVPDPPPQGKYPSIHSEDITSSIKVFKKENRKPLETKLRKKIKESGELLLLSEM